MKAKYIKILAETSLHAVKKIGVNINFILVNFKTSYTVMKVA